VLGRDMLPLLLFFTSQHVLVTLTFVAPHLVDHMKDKCIKSIAMQGWCITKPSTNSHQKVICIRLIKEIVGPPADMDTIIRIAIIASGGIKE
jgi:hypothetical protein